MRRRRRLRNSTVATLLQHFTARCVCCAPLICISPVTRQVKVLDRDKDGHKSTHDEKLGKVPIPVPTPETRNQITTCQFSFEESLWHHASLAG